MQKKKKFTRDFMVIDESLADSQTDRQTNKEQHDHSTKHKSLRVGQKTKSLPTEERTDTPFHSHLAATKKM